MSRPSPNEPSAKIQQLEEHESMQLSEVIFRIEDKRFKVPLLIFSESEPFCAMLENAAANNPDARQIICLDEFSKDEFQSFMKYIYQRRLGCRSVVNLVGYTAVLKISTKWAFNQVRAAAIREFPAVDVVDKIVLAREYYVHEWLVTSLNDYARLGRSITLQDVQRLGTNYILKITQLRDYDSNQGYQRRTHNFRPALEELFQEEIKQLGIELPPATPSAVEDFDFVDIFFLVEGQLFKSYRQCFEDLPVFQTMFSLPVGENKIQDGVTKSQPLRLDGIAKSDFAPFVDLMNSGPEEFFSLAEWISILKLSTMWEFTRLRQYAITRISELGISPARRVNLARDYQIQDWFLPGIVAYAQQRDAITADDVDLLGWEFVLKILQARERFAVSYHYKPGIEERVNHNFTCDIKEVFAEEIDRIRQMFPE